MTMRQLFVHVSEPQINLLDFFYVRKLVTVCLLDVFEEVFEGCELLYLKVDPFVLILQSSQPYFGLFDLPVFLYDFDTLEFRRFQVFVFACVLSAQE